MADRFMHYIDSHTSHVRQPEVSLFNQNYQTNIQSEASPFVYIHRSAPGNTAPFTSTGQPSAPYYNSNVMERSIYDFNDSGIVQEGDSSNSQNVSIISNVSTSTRRDQLKLSDGSVTLQLGNLDTTSDQTSLKQYLMSKLQSITPILSFTFEGVIAKITLPSIDHAKQVVSYLHRKKVGHKRITVSYTKDCSSMDPLTLKCQVAGLLKDIPYYRISMHKFRELFQSRFKTSISVHNLCAMNEICIVTENGTEKFVNLRPELIQSIERGDLNDLFVQSVPYCCVHLKKGQRGWAEQEIEGLPNVRMSVAEVRSILSLLIQRHNGNLPVASLLHCIQGELKYNIISNESGINLEHLISCVNEIEITTNKFGIKILNWVADNDHNREWSDDYSKAQQYIKGINVADPYGKFLSEVVELLTVCPKSTMKFSRFIPTYHNTFSKQCRVADYGYVKLIDLFEAMPLIVQIMGEGDNRQITLTHQYQMRRLASDLQKAIRTSTNKSIRLSHIPMMLSNHHKKFDITDYGVCYLKDIVEVLQSNNLIVFDMLTKSDDMNLLLPKRRQSNVEQRKTSGFATETIELLKSAPQYTIAYEKFSCSYHYHFTYQLRLSDYGHTKLADMMEGLAGIVKVSNEESRKIFLCPKVAQRVFSEQLRDITEMITGKSFAFINVDNVLDQHKNKFGYQIKPETLGFKDMWIAMKSVPFVEVIVESVAKYMVCHHDDDNYKYRSHILVVLLDSLAFALNTKFIPMSQLINSYFQKFEEELSESLIESMNHLFDIQIENNIKVVSLSSVALFLLPIVSILKTVQSITVSQLKLELASKLNLFNAFFQIGYPDLESLIKSFPDIFWFNELSEKSEITFNKRSVFAAHNEHFDTQPKAVPLSTNKTSLTTVPHIIQNQSSNIENTSLVTSHRVPLGELETYFTINQQCNEESRADKPKFMRSNLNEMIPNNFAISRKENNYYPANVVQPNTQESNSLLSKRRTLKRTYDQISISTNTSPPREPPSVPFWMDPIWHTSPTTPLNRSFHIPIPELLTFPFQPVLDTPTMMEHLARRNVSRFNFGE